MQPPAGDWPTTPWPLTAPESYALLNWPGGEGGQALKLGLSELTTRGVLQIEEVDQGRPVFASSPAQVLRPGRRLRVPSEPPLASLWLLFTSTPVQTFAHGVQGVPLTDFIRAAQRRYGNSFHRYLSSEVIPSLVDRGLMTYQTTRMLWIFKSSRLVLTPAGEAMRGDLEHRLSTARQHFGGWVDGDPARAMAFLALSGAALLLMDPLFPDFQRLTRQYSAMSDTTYASTYPVTSPVYDSGSEPDEPAPDALGERQQQEAPITEDATSGGLNLAGLDFSGLNLGGLDPSSLSFDFDLSAFDSLDSVVSAVESTVESVTSSDSGGWGGSDSGGSSDSGDGGGGGGSE